MWAAPRLVDPHTCAGVLVKSWLSHAITGRQESGPSGPYQTSNKPRQTLLRERHSVLSMPTEQFHCGAGEQVLECRSSSEPTIREGALYPPCIF